MVTTLTDRARIGFAQKTDWAHLIEAARLRVLIPSRSGSFRRIVLFHTDPVIGGKLRATVSAAVATSKAARIRNA